MKVTVREITTKSNDPVGSPVYMIGAQLEHGKWFWVKVSNYYSTPKRFLLMKTKSGKVLIVRDEALETYHGGVNTINDAWLFDGWANVEVLVGGEDE